MPSIAHYRIRPGAKVRLHRLDPDDTSAFDGEKDAGERRLTKLTTELERLQELLYADHRFAVLVVLQGMDSAGKDGTIRRVFAGVNPDGVRVAAFRQPTQTERDHDFLWRVHAEVPSRGEMVLFNRSHYEDVLITRVHGWITRPVWEARYREINEFERELTNEGTVVLKFFLHISRGEQRRRLEDRLRDPTKHWKFRESDVLERERWPAYTRAYEEMLSKTSTAWAPWYAVPSNHKWYRDLIVSERIVACLQGLKMHYPPLPPEYRRLRVR